MDGFFLDDCKVNMGSRQNITKEQLLKQNKEERLKREAIRKEAEAATLIQKTLRAYKIHQQMIAETVDHPQLKIKETIQGFKAAYLKMEP